MKQGDVLLLIMMRLRFGVVFYNGFVYLWLRDDAVEYICSWFWCGIKRRII